MNIPVIRYSRDKSDFTKTLRARVDTYFKERNISRKGNWRLHLKTTVMIALYFVPWALITWGLAGSGWMFWVAEFAMGLGLAGLSVVVNENPLNSGGFDHHPALSVFDTKQL